MNGRVLRRSLIKVAEELAQKLPENVPVILAVDNDASMTGMKKAQQAAAYLGDRAVCVQPEFTMTQIQKYQQGRGADEKGRPPLPSDFNDLHKLAGIDAVKIQLEQGMKQQTEQTAAIPDSVIDDERRLDNGSTGHASPPPHEKQENSTPDVAPEPLQPKKPVLDLAYHKPPDGLIARYIVVDGKYISASNGQAVLFTDAGKTLTTPKSDAQTVNDMLEVAKAKGWDNIKITGNHEFKRMMYIAAESQGIATKGYAPNPEDLEMVQRMRESYALNGIENNPSRRQAVSDGLKDKAQDKPQQRNQEAERPPRREPEASMLAAADRLEAQSLQPSNAAINISEKADTQQGVRLDAIGGKEIPSEVKAQTDRMRGDALQTSLAAAKSVYLRKSEKLGKPARAKLAFYEKAVMDTIRDLKGDNRDLALKNYYEHTAQQMSGKNLKMPDPMQIPSPSQTVVQKQERQREQVREPSQEVEMTR